MLRLPVPLNKEPRLQMWGGGRSLVPPYQLTRQEATLNNRESIMCDEEELWRPSRHWGAG